MKNDLYASVYYIALIGTGYTKDEIITFLKKEWEIPNETIKKGYELQLKMEGLPKRYTGDLNLNKAYKINVNANIQTPKTNKSI